MRISSRDAFNEKVGEGGHDGVQGGGAQFCGESLDEALRWKGGGDVSALAGKPVRLRFALNDADDDSFRFRD